MTNLIQSTGAFKKLDKLSQNFLNKRANRLQVEDAIIQARNIGLENWRAQTSLPNKWRRIVEEVIENNKVNNEKPT